LGTRNSSTEGRASKNLSPPHVLGGLHMINEVINARSRPEMITLAAGMRAAQELLAHLIRRPSEYG
jgi:hypothetical protein